MGVRRPTTSSPASPEPLSALLDLSGTFTRSKTGGVFSQALTSILTGTGLHAGVVHETTPGGFELAAEQGMPLALREHIGSISSATPAWFVVQHAVKRRRVLVEDKLAAMFGSRVPASVLRTAGWNALACAPIVMGRDVFGAVTLAAPSAELFSPQILAVLETVTNMLALFLAHEKALSDGAPLTESPASLVEVDDKLTRLATVGTLALAFADDFRVVSAQLTSFIKHQDKWLGELRTQHPGAAPLIRALEPLQEEAASALMLVRASGGRLLAALEENALEAIDAGALVHEVVGHVEPKARARNVDVLVAVQPGAEALIRGRRSEIRQLILSLVSDGVDACGREDKPDHPTIPVPQMQIVSISVTRDKGKIQLLFEHSGKVVSVENRHTTTRRATRPKEPLGIVLARNIAATHEGSLEVSRSELGGTAVRVLLPAAVPPPSSKRNKGGPASSKRTRPTLDALEVHPTTKRDGWTAKPGVLSGGQPAPIRAPAPKKAGAAEEPPLSDIDVLASTERGAALVASNIGLTHRGQGTVAITNSPDAATSNAVPPSTRRRSQAGPSSKRRN